jgi:hypothetical protein
LLTKTGKVRHKFLKYRIFYVPFNVHTGQFSCPQIRETWQPYCKKKNYCLWDVAPGRLVETDWHFRGADGGGSMLLWNINQYLWAYIMQNPRRHLPSYPSPEISLWNVSINQTKYSLWTKCGHPRISCGLWAKFCYNLNNQVYLLKIKCKWKHGSL